ncbi:lipase maturation factor 1 [Reticulomyxa filosa]|uniref:Lipase maturation factor 1 n=1 Tax=Reticulomyxa filosa TaxID=46433 RepID=X6NGA3_RETFI|nr:lipase maturation factor 1 [Reticulomyxa filosa]|eukprot:ETO25355.1 lipase maturation factor 1 [Reticulomyxa filosa]
MKAINKHVFAHITVKGKKDRIKKTGIKSVGGTKKKIEMIFQLKLLLGVCQPLGVLLIFFIFVLVLLHRSISLLPPQTRGGLVIDIAIETQPTYFLTRIVILQGFLVLHMIAFLTAFFQWEGCFGNRGILPVQNYLELLLSSNNSQSRPSLVLYLDDCPTLLWLFPLRHSSAAMKWLLMIGALLCAFEMYYQSLSALSLLIIWLIQLSFVNVGQSFTAYGWHPQLLEFSCLCIWLGSVGEPSPSFNVYK